MASTAEADLESRTARARDWMPHGAAPIPVEELAAFKELRPEIGMGLGVVDIKRTDIESADEIARGIERAESVIGEGRIRYIHPDCGFWMLKRPIADGKIRALVEGRDLYEGRERVSAA